MENVKETTDVLNDLVETNNDRIVGYEHALKELKGTEPDLKILFEGFIDESRQIKMQLGTEVEVAGKDIAQGTSGSAKIHRTWMDIKNIFSKADRHSILESCEYGEDVTQKAYNTALSTDNIPAYLREMIEDQQQKLKSSHNEVKSLRDSSN